MYLMSRHHDEKTLVLVFSFKIYDLSLVSVAAKVVLFLFPLLLAFFLPSLQYSFLMAKLLNLDFITSTTYSFLESAAGGNLTFLPLQYCQ